MPSNTYLCSTLTPTQQAVTCLMLRVVIVLRTYAVIARCNACTAYAAVSARPSWFITARIQAEDPAPVSKRSPLTYTFALRYQLSSPKRDTVTVK